MQRLHPLAIPLLILVCVLGGMGLGAWTGAPGYGAAVLLFVPIVLFFGRLYAALRKPARP